MTERPPGTGDDSAVTQDYLKAVWLASEMGGAGASITGLARRMGVAPSTASENVTRLVEAGLLDREQRGRWVHFSVNPEAMADLAAVLAGPGPGPLCGC